MSQKGPIVVIENDPDDREFLTDALNALEIGNPVRIFPTAEGALDYFRTTEDQPFLILSDIHLGGMSGLELRRAINGADFLRRKTIPFIILTDFATAENVKEAYDLTVQGLYRKAATMPQLKEQLKLIVTYWKHCLHPNSGELF